MTKHRRLQGHLSTVNVLWQSMEINNFWSGIYRYEPAINNKDKLNLYIKSINYYDIFGGMPGTGSIANLLTLSLPNFTKLTLPCRKFNLSIFRQTGNLVKCNVLVASNAYFRRDSSLIIVSSGSALFATAFICLCQCKR